MGAQDWYAPLSPRAARRVPCSIEMLRHRLSTTGSGVEPREASSKLDRYQFQTRSIDEAKDANEAMRKASTIPGHGCAHVLMAGRGRVFGYEE
jgi:hypothetical protein